MSVLRSEVCCDFACVFLSVLGSFSGPYEGHFGTPFSPDGSFEAKRAICIICYKLQCFSRVLRTDGSLFSLLAECLCSTGRRCLSDLRFCVDLEPLGGRFWRLCWPSWGLLFMSFFCIAFLKPSGIKNTRFWTPILEGE